MTEQEAQSVGERTIELLREIERLRADAARLDYLGTRCTGASDSERYLPFRVYWGGGTHRDVREAIDAAMAKEPPK